MTPRVVAYALFVAGLSSVLGCSGTSQQAPPKGRTVDAGTAGSIAGRVTFAGTPPAPEIIRMGSDPNCAPGGATSTQSDALLVAKDGALQNTFVYIKDGLEAGYTFDAPTTPVVLDQKGCHYSPRVLGVRVNQPLMMANGDETFHNVHALPKTNQEFNQGLVTKGSSMTHTFAAPEVMVRFKCDVHGWMSAYVGVVQHPFFAVTGADGSFTLAGVPPGIYTIEAWHEKFGVKTAQVTVGPSQAQHVSFSFAAN